MIKKMILFLCLWLLTSCQVLDRIDVPSGYPLPPVRPHINYQFDQLTIEERRNELDKLIRFHSSMESYIETLYEIALNEDYTTKYDRNKLCRADLYIRKINLPKSLNIQDNGKYNDDEIIMLLANRVKRLRTLITEHNIEVDRLKEDYNRYCISR